jgi:hypothetical protein
MNQQTDQRNTETIESLNGAESFFRSQRLTIECRRWLVALHSQRCNNKTKFKIFEISEIRSLDFYVFKNAHFADHPENILAVISFRYVDVSAVGHTQCGVKLFQNYVYFICCQTKTCLKASNCTENFKENVHLLCKESVR